MKGAELERLASLFVIFIVGLFPSAQTLAEPLISAAEAALPDAKQASDRFTRGVARGPGITLLSPASGPLSSPFDLDVLFEPRGARAIDKDSVRVLYVKDPVLNITDRVQKAIHAQGIKLNGVEMPPGEHVLRILLRDQEGRESRADFSLKVTR